MKQAGKIKLLGGVPICMDMNELQLEFVEENDGTSLGLPIELHFKNSQHNPVIDLYVKEWEGEHHYEIWIDGGFSVNYKELTRKQLIKKLDKLKYGPATALLRGKKINNLLQSDGEV